MLRSGIVITGGTAQIVNISNFIHDISGYKVRTGYPKQLFSCSGCCGLSDTSAATSIGLIQAARYGLNCAIVQEVVEEEPAEEVVEDLAIETAVVEPSVEPEDNKNLNLFGEEVKEEEPKKKPEPKPKKAKEPRKGKRPTWTRFLEDLFSDVEKEIDDENV